MSILWGQTKRSGGIVFSGDAMAGDLKLAGRGSAGSVVDDQVLSLPVFLFRVPHLNKES
jgi:hypothetical protein